MGYTGSMRVSPSLIVPALAATLALGGCGGDDDPTASTGSAAPSTTTAAAGGTTTGSTTATTADGAAAGTPRERIAAISKALADVESYHIQGETTDEDGKATIEGDVDRTGNASISYELGGREIEIRVVSTLAYLRGNRRFWLDSAGGKGGEQGRKAAGALAGRWVKAPVAAAGVGDLLKELSPKQLSRCVGVGLGTLRDGGRTRVDGQEVDVLIDEGDKPGTTPGRLYTARSGPPLPLRVLQTGERRPGGTIDEECSNEDDSSTSSDLRLSRFGEPLEVEAPAGAIEIPSDGGTESPSTS